MLELDKNKVVVSQRIPIWVRLLVSLLGAVLAYKVTFIFELVFSSPGVFAYFIFFSILVLSLLLPHWRYRSIRNLMVFTPLIIVAWIAILFAITPIFTKQYYLSEAAKIVPVYSTAKVSKITYSYGGFDVGTSVLYLYETKTPSEDYKKMHDLYMTQIGQRGYDVIEDKDASITFKKHNDSSPTISLGVSGRYPDTIEVSVNPISSSCAFSLLAGDFKTFVMCQKGWPN